jgi:integrase
MTDTTTSTQPAKRGRNGSVILTDRICEKRVTQRTKIYDRKCSGLYVSITTAGVATFSFKFTDPTTGKQPTGWLGVYNPQTFKVEDARSKVYKLKGRGGAAVAETLRRQKVQQHRQGKTVAEAVEARIAWMSFPVKKPDGEMRPRLEAWEGTARHLRRFLVPDLGRLGIAEVKRRDLAELQQNILDGKYVDDKGKRTKRGSVSTVRHMRKAASSFFGWCVEEGLIENSPATHLGALDAEHGRSRVLTEDEIRIFWHGLDREDLPWGRRTRLALKFELVTMLRSRELLGSQRHELVNVDRQNYLNVPLKRVKKRRPIVQPLTPLAMSILNEAMRSSNHEHIFATSKDGNEDAPAYRTAMADALRGRTARRADGTQYTRTPGLCALLGLKPFTPHDLRRTAATWARNLGQPLSKIALCLDHRRQQDDDGVRLSAVTLKHYVHAHEIDLREKLETLTALEGWLLKVISDPGTSIDREGLQLAA